MEVDRDWAGYSKHLLHLVSSLLLLQVKMLEGDGGFPAGYCQVYSYNINQRGSRLQEKHFFVCCNNIDEKVCPGNTYQKPSRTECKSHHCVFTMASSTFSSCSFLLIRTVSRLSLCLLVIMYQ